MTERKMGEFIEPWQNGEAIFRAKIALLLDNYAEYLEPVLSAGSDA